MIAFGFGYLPVLIPERKCQMLRLCSVQAAQSFGKQKFVVYYSSMYFLFLIFFLIFFFFCQTNICRQHAKVYNAANAENFVSFFM